jgi:dihydropteroate synthase
MPETGTIHLLLRRPQTKATRKMAQTRSPGPAADAKTGCQVRVLCAACPRHLRGELSRLNASKEEAGAIRKSAQSFVLKLQGIPDSDVSTFHSVFESGGVQSISRRGAADGVSLIISGSGDRLESILSGNQGLTPQIADVILSCRIALENYSRTGFKLTYPSGELDLTAKTAVMGVVNVTPDSFSDGGDFYSAESAAEHALELVDAGADIIDVGGESTRPGSEPVSATDEIKRVLPVIRAVAPKVPVPVSIDTYKPEVAREALEHGARIVNDVSGLRENPALAELAAEKEVPVILMHMKGSPKTMQEDPVYDDLISEIYASLSASVKAALAAGIAPDRVVIDPGIGFGKTFEDNLVILDRLREFRSLGVPICIGVSRKAFLGATLGIAEPKKRLVGSLAANVIAVREGARIVRVHDVQETVEAVRVADAVAAGRLPSEM